MCAKYVTRVMTRLALAAVGVGSILGPAGAQARPGSSTLLVNTSPSSLYVYDGLHYGGWAWSGTTAKLHATFGAGIGTASSLTDLPTMMGYDALWVDQRFQSAPLASEVANILAFAATGRRVVIVGENATWGPWNAAILGALGGSEGALASLNGPGCNYGLAHAVGSNALTTGVGGVNMACGGFAVGGTALFDYNVATLWGAQQNVLTVLDANLFDERFMTPDGWRFRQNVIAWAAAPDVAVTATPEPASLALVGGGLLALGAAVRRRRR
jgi:hypothetical protein